MSKCKDYGARGLMSKIMLNFNKILTSKIISLIIAVSFLMADISYAGTYQQGVLRVPVGQGHTYSRMGRAAGKKEEAQPFPAKLLVTNNYTEVMRFPDLYDFLMDAAKEYAGTMTVVVLGPGFVKLFGGKFSPQIVEVAAALGPHRARITVVDHNPEVAEAVNSPVYILKPIDVVHSALVYKRDFWIKMKQALASVLQNVQPSEIYFDRGYTAKLPYPVEYVQADFYQWDPVPQQADIIISTAALLYTLRTLASQSGRVKFLAKIFKVLKPGGRLYLTKVEMARVLMKHVKYFRCPEDLEILCSLLQVQTGAAISFKYSRDIVELACGASAPELAVPMQLLKVSGRVAGNSI